MEWDIDEDNECPWCGENSFYEYIDIDPKTKTGKYEYSCPHCNVQGTKVIQ